MSEHLDYLEQWTWKADLAYAASDITNTHESVEVGHLSRLLQLIVTLILSL